MKRWLKTFIISQLSLLICNIVYCSDWTLFLDKKLKIDDSKSPIRFISQTLFDKKGNIYLLDNNNLIKKIDNDGKDLDEIVTQGMGPDEISQVNRIDFTNDLSQLVLLDRDKKKIILLDLSGKLIRTIDPPVQQWPESIISSLKEDYYLILMKKKDSDLLCRLDGSFNYKNSFFKYKAKWEMRDLNFYNVFVDHDSNGNLYVIDNLEYIIYKYGSKGSLIGTFSDPGKEYIPIKDNPPKSFQSKKFSQWFNSFSMISNCYILNNNYFVVFYNNERKRKEHFTYLYDIYSLDSKRISSGVLHDMRPVGKDDKGRLVCSKTEISDDGTEVSNWLYFYSIKNEILNNN